MAQLLLYLPDELVARPRRAVPPRERSPFVRRLLVQALAPEEEDPLRRIALEVEQDERLSAEMAAWEEATLADGLGGRPRRGEVWWVDLEPTRGSEIRKRRPTAIVSVDALDEVRRTTVVVPLSSSPVPRPPLVVPVPSLGPGSVAICDQLRAVDKRGGSGGARARSPRPTRARSRRGSGWFSLFERGPVTARSNERMPSREPAEPVASIASSRKADGEPPNRSPLGGGGAAAGGVRNG